jgi:hypothetical protein
MQAPKIELVTSNFRRIFTACPCKFLEIERTKNYRHKHNNNEEEDKRHHRRWPCQFCSLCCTRPSSHCCHLVLGVASQTQVEHGDGPSMTGKLTWLSDGSGGVRKTWARGSRCRLGRFSLIAVREWERRDCWVLAVGCERVASMATTTPL